MVIFHGYVKQPDGILKDALSAKMAIWSISIHLSARRYRPWSAFIMFDLFHLLQPRSTIIYGYSFWIVWISTSTTSEVFCWLHHLQTWLINGRSPGAQRCRQTCAPDATNHGKHMQYVHMRSHALPATHSSKQNVFLTISISYFIIPVLSHHYIETNHHPNFQKKHLFDTFVDDVPAWWIFLYS